MWSEFGPNVNKSDVDRVAVHVKNEAIVEERRMKNCNLMLTGNRIFSAS